MWPFKKKSVVSDSTSIEHVKKELPSEYLAQVISALDAIVDTYATINTNLIIAYRKLFENPGDVYVASRGFTCGKLCIHHIYPTESSEFGGETYTANDTTLIVAYTIDGDTSHSVRLKLTEVNKSKVMHIIVYGPAEIISKYQVKYNAHPIKQAENKPSEPHDKLTKVLTALMKEDPKLTDRLLGFPDTEVQEIALHNMK